MRRGRCPSCYHALKPGPTPQVVTAGALLLAMRRPLPVKSIAAGWVCPPALQRVPLSALTQMLTYAGPICIVLLTKTFIYSVPPLCCLSVVGHAVTWTLPCGLQISPE